MEEFSRREFVRRSAAGIVLAGSGMLLGAGAASAASQFNRNRRVSFGAVEVLMPPYIPTRVGGRVYCPAKDPNPDREYAALIRVLNGQEQYPAALEGIDFDPFDGSSVAVSGTASCNDYYICRGVINGVPSLSYPEDEMVCPSGEANKELTSRELSSFARYLKPPKPPKPKLEKGSSPRNIWVSFGSWRPDWSGHDGEQPTVKWVAAKRLVFTHWNADHPARPPRWQKLSTPRPGENNDNHPMGNNGNKANKAYLIPRTSDFKDVFNDAYIRDNQLPHVRHGYISEILYDYGPNVDSRVRYRGAQSEALIVDASSGKPVEWA